jgi:hypothetical protein
VITSAILPSLAIIVLYYIPRLIHRIVAATCFTFLFSGAVALLTSSRPPEIFAATVALVTSHSRHGLLMLTSLVQILRSRSGIHRKYWLQFHSLKEVARLCNDVTNSVRPSIPFKSLLTLRLWMNWTESESLCQWVRCLRELARQLVP